MTFPRIIASLTLAAGVLAAAAPASAYAGQQYASQAKVSIGKARMLALKAVPGGTITDQELEKENGGLRYSFDVKVHGKTHEIGVDAKTGKILENSVEGAKPD